MLEVLERIKKWVGQLTEVGLLLIAFGIVLQILFKSPVEFIGGDIVGNLIALIQVLGENGVVGLVAIAIIFWLFSRRNIA